MKEPKAVMTLEEMQQSAWIGQQFRSGETRAVIVRFHGLGGGIKNGPSYEEQEWGENGGLVVYPYYGPWSWKWDTDQTRRIAPRERRLIL